MIPSSLLISKGVTQRQLQEIEAPLVAKDDKRDRAEIVEDFENKANQILVQMPQDEIDTKKLRDILLRVSQELFESYILERESGLYPTVEKMWEILKAKTRLGGLLELENIFAGRFPQDKVQDVEFGNDFMLFLQISDELSDTKADFNNQPA